MSFEIINLWDMGVFRFFIGAENSNLQDLD